MMVAVLGEYDDTVDYMGPNNSWKKYLIPRTLWGIDCNIASYRHDWPFQDGARFHHGTAMARDRAFADIVFAQIGYRLPDQLFRRCGGFPGHRNLGTPSGIPPRGNIIRNGRGRAHAFMMCMTIGSAFRLSDPASFASA